MSDDEKIRKEDQPSKQGKKQTLAGATHLLKAEALKRLELKDAEEPSKEVGSSGSSFSVDDRPPGTDIKVTGSGEYSVPDSAEQAVEIRDQEADGINRPQSGDQGLGRNTKDINNSNPVGASDLGNEDATGNVGPRPSNSRGTAETEDLKISSKPKSNKEEVSKDLNDNSAETAASSEKEGNVFSDLATSSEPSIQDKSDSKTDKVIIGSNEAEPQISSGGSSNIAPEQLVGEKREEDSVVSANQFPAKEIGEESPPSKKEDFRQGEGTQASDKSGLEKGVLDSRSTSNIEMASKPDNDEKQPVKESDLVDKDEGNQESEHGKDDFASKESSKGDESGEKRQTLEVAGIKEVDGKGKEEGGDLQGDAGFKEKQNLKSDDNLDNQKDGEAADDEVIRDTVIEKGEAIGVQVDKTVEDSVNVKQDLNESNNDPKSDGDVNANAGDQVAGSTAKTKTEEVAGQPGILNAEIRDADNADGSGNVGIKHAVDSNADQTVDAGNDDGKIVSQNSISDGEKKASLEGSGQELKADSSSGEEVQINDRVKEANEEGKEKIETERKDGESTGEARDMQPSGELIGEAKGLQPSGEVTGDAKDMQPSGELTGEAKDMQPSGDLPGEAKDMQSPGELTGEAKDMQPSSSKEVGEFKSGDATTQSKTEAQTERKPVNVIKNIDTSSEPEVRGEGIKLKKAPESENGKTSDEENSKEAGNEGEGVTDGMEENDGEEVPLQIEEHTVPSDFYYDYDEYMSKPFTTDGVPQDMLSLYHSFGFECTKRSNLHILDEENMLFSAGNMVQILNIKTNKMTYIRSTGGGGIGAIAIHPSRRYFAVAEKGVKPNIVIYEYPSLKLHRILRDGTELAYANLDFSPNGEKLASVGSAPDYMLTVWDWKNENIVLRTKAFSQEVYKVAFSPEDEGHLCSSGTGHIRFWKMAITFTGLKLQGELGRFGTTEISDIAGFVELPDGKVLSGSEWGNMLLWDGGLIKVEIARKGKKTCHLGMIEQFFLDEGELITIGADGFVKVWDFESIDTADSVDESKVFEMEPMSELKVGSDVKLMSMVKSVDANEASIWYAQDASGGIWKLDLSFSHTSQAPKKLYTYHAGAISGLAVSPITHLSATTGADHTVRLYDYLAKTQLCHSKFTAAGSSILWMPKVVDSDGLSILAGFADGVVRYFTVTKGAENAVATKKNVPNFNLKLNQVFKPHTKPVTSLAVSKDGKFLATGAEDSTVFFFSIDKLKFKAIGFIEAGTPVVSLDWSSVQKKNHLLICCNDGCVLEVSCPKPDKYDTSKTYLIPLPGLKRKEFKFKGIKDKLVKAEEELRKAKEEEEKQKQLEEERKRKKARGIEEDEEEEDENKEEESIEEEEPIEEEEVYHEPGQIVKGFYKGESGDFWLLLDGWDAGYVYECGFPSDKDTTVESEPLRAIKFDDIDDVAVQSHYFSKSGQYLALGLQNGAIRIQVLESHDLNTLNSYWRLNVHDNQSGAIMDISMSFDEKFLLSIGKDGNFFVYSFMDAKKVMGLIGKQRAEVAAKAQISSLMKIDDIEDPNHYSIELEKQKAEHDKMVRLAEEKKQQVRQTISLLRREFKRLAARNQEMPPYLQLPPSDFIIDPEMEKDIEKETDKKIGLLELEMAWESEKCSLALKKLESRFTDMIECERFILRAFNTSHKISSYRATVMPPEFNEASEVNRKRSKAGEGEVAPLAAGGKRLSFFSKKLRGMSRENSVSEDVSEPVQAKKPKPAQNLDEKIAKAIEKAEQKKKRRQARQAEWDEFYRSKPDENKEDPLDLAAIKEAQDNMGDFKLKTAKDYIVPEKQRVNADKKRVQLVEMKEQIHQLKQNFNEKLLNLRSKKISFIEEVKVLTAELETVQNGIPSSMHVAIPPIPVMQPDEQPEKLYEYTNEILMKFKQETDDEVQNLKSENTGGGFGGGFGGFGGGEQNQQNPSKLTSQMASTRTGTEQRGRSTSILSTLSSHPRSGSSIHADRGTPDAIREEQMISVAPSDMELKVRDEQRMRLVYKRNMLLRRIRELLVTFDAELRTLRHEKIHLNVDLKNANLRMITLFEELVLLKEFEKRENALMGKVVSKTQEREDMQDKVEDCEMKLQSKKEEIDRLQERDKALYTTFTNTVGDSNKFEAFLTKVFKKKIKRVKKTEHDAGSDEESDDDDSDDDYDSEEDEDSDTEELDDSVCPPGCDQAIFDQVCQLREKRLDLEEASIEEKKAAEALKKELDALQKKAKIIDTGLMTAEADLEAFQREKQQKLNELDVVVTLKLSQLQYLNNSTVPQDLSQSLVFTSSSLERLQGRIKELEKEKAEQKKLYWQRRQQHVQLIRDRKSMETKITQLEEKVEQMQLLKFGRLVNLEKLETVSVNKLAEEIKEQLRTQEFASAKEIASWEKRIDEAKARLTLLTRENTRRLDTYTVLLQEQKELEGQLDSRQKNLGGEFQGNRKADYQERQRLIQLAQLQSQEIEALKEEIGLLSRKGGHILPPSQAPVPQAPSAH